MSTLSSIPSKSESYLTKRIAIRFKIIEKSFNIQAVVSSGFNFGEGVICFILLFFLIMVITNYLNVPEILCSPSSTEFIYIYKRSK